MRAPGIVNVVHRKHVFVGLFTFLLCFPILIGAQDSSSQLRIVVLEGEGAINNISQRRARNPVVQVLDQNNMPVSGAVVTFLLPETGPGGEFSGGVQSLAIVTDSKGQAMGRGLVPNRSAGQFQIRVVASYQGQTNNAAINQTNAEQSGVQQGGVPKKYLILGGIAGAAAVGAALALAGHGGSSTSSPATTPAQGAVGIVIVPGTPSFQPPH
jgi:hypothetical protein